MQTFEATDADPFLVNHLVNYWSLLGASVLRHDDRDLTELPVSELRIQFGAGLILTVQH